MDDRSLRAFFTQVLQGLGAPVTDNNLSKMAAVAIAEGNNSGTFNPFNSVGGGDQFDNFNSVGVKNYPDWDTGVQWTVNLLSQSRPEVVAMRANLRGNLTYRDWIAKTDAFYHVWKASFPNIDQPRAQGFLVNNVGAGSSTGPGDTGGAPPGSSTPRGPETQADIAEGLGNLGVPGYEQYATDPRKQVNSRYQALMAAGGGGGGVAAPPDPTFFNWQEHPQLNDQYNSLSPHLKAFEKWTFGRHGGEWLGDYVEKTVSSGGPAISSHSFGAAFDWGYTKNGATRADADEMIDLITKNPGAFGIQAIHDYTNNRIWRIGREGDLGGGWQRQTSGGDMGNSGSTWLHFEVNQEDWDRVGRQNWRMMNQAAKGVYSEGGQALTPEQFGQRAERMGNRGNPLFEDYATIGPRKLERRQNRYISNTPGQPGGTEGPPSQALSTLLGNIGVEYPNAPTPTPALMAYLAGVNLDLSTAEDLWRKANQRIRVGATDTRQDIRRLAQRTKEGITGDLASRGVLSSGEANTRYVRQAQDVAEQRSDLATQTGQLREDASGAYNEAVGGLRRGALQSIADLDTQQQIAEATNRATARGARRATRASWNQFDQEAQAREDQLQRLIDFYAGLGTSPTPPPLGNGASSSLPRRPGGNRI